MCVSSCVSIKVFLCTFGSIALEKVDGNSLNFARKLLHSLRVDVLKRYDEVLEVWTLKLSKGRTFA